MLKPLSELQPPPLTLKQIGDDRDAAALLTRGGPDLMAQVASLNGAERAFGFGPRAQANRGDARPLP